MKKAMKNASVRLQDIELTVTVMCPNCNRYTQYTMQYDEEVDTFPIHCYCIGTSCSPVNLSRKEGLEILKKIFKGETADE